MSQGAVSLLLEVGMKRSFSAVFKRVAGLLSVALWYLSPYRSIDKEREK